MAAKQMIWHAFHAGSLCQYEDYDKRLVFIERNKPPHELSIRVQLMKRVVGKLPPDFVKACEVAREAWKVARETREAREIAWKALEAREAQEAAWKALKAREAAYKKHKLEIERLHVIECPDCPWDGATIFSNTEEVT
jgi:hypothetical protein